MSRRRNRRNRSNPGTQKIRDTKVGQERKFEWVTIEEYDSNGKPIIPRRAIQGTVRVRYDPNQHKDLKLRILTGVGPEGSIIGQYKLYDIKKFSMRGWRMEAEAIVEIETTRAHEEEWFKAFKGSDVTIVHPGLPGSISDEYQMKVTKSNFSKKITTYKGDNSTKKEDRSFEGHLWMKETGKSILLRRKGESAGYVVLAIITALIGAGITWLV